MSIEKDTDKLIEGAKEDPEKYTIEAPIYEEANKLWRIIKRWSTLTIDQRKFLENTSKRLWKIADEVRFHRNDKKYNC